MPIIADYTIVRMEDGLLTIDMTPPVAIGGWNIRFQCMKRFDSSSGLITKSVASGFNNASGINVANSGQGIFDVTINSVDTSGFDPGCYAYKVDRLDSGNVTCLAEGYMVLKP